MRFIPTTTIIQNEKLFPGILSGELLLLIAGACAAFLYGSYSVFLVGWMCGAVIARAFLIWAWGQRYPQTNLFYFMWTLPGLLRDALLGLGCLSFWASKGFTVHKGQIMTGDSSIATWGIALLFLGLVVRSTGLLWTLRHRKPAETRDGDTWPTFILATITAFVVFSFAIAIYNGGFRGIMMALLFIPQYGYQVYL